METFDEGVLDGYYQYYDANSWAARAMSWRAEGNHPAVGVICPTCHKNISLISVIHETKDCHCEGAESSVDEVLLAIGLSELRDRFSPSKAGREQAARRH